MIGMVLGIIIGIAIHLFCDPEQARTILLLRGFEIGGNLFLNLFRMIVVPVVLVSMTIGTASMNNPILLGRVGAKTLICFAVTTVLSSMLGIFFAMTCRIGSGSNIELPKDAGIKLTGSVHSLADTLTNMIPSNLFQSFVDANMLQVIVIAIIGGIALSKISFKIPHLRQLLQEFDYLNLSVVDLILKLAPYGVFCLLAHTFSCFGLSVLLPMSKYILCFLGVSAIVLFVIYPILLLCVKVSP